MNRISPSAPPRTRLAAALAIALLAAACGAEPRGSPAPTTLQDPGRHALHVGMSDEGTAAAIGRVVSARVSENGGHVVVLDFVAPYVKVFDKAGRFQGAFLGRGGGPREARHPSALAISGDSLLLVADGPEHLSLYDLQGNLRADIPVSGLLPLGATAACGDEWVVYGPRRDASAGRGRATWVHRIRLDPAGGETRVRSMVADSVVGLLSVGMPYGVVSDGRGVVVRHTLGTRPRVLRMECGGGEPRVLHEGEPASATGPERDGERLRTSIRPGMRVPGGAAITSSGVVFGEKVLLGQGASRLDLTLLGRGGGEPRLLSLAGDYVLQDSRPGVGVLVSTMDPVPQVFLLKENDFLGMFHDR